MGASTTTGRNPESFQAVCGLTQSQERAAVSAATILRTIGFGALGVGLWEPLSSDSGSGALLTAGLVAISCVLFIVAHGFLGLMENEE